MNADKGGFSVPQGPANLLAGAHIASNGCREARSNGSRTLSGRHASAHAGRARARALPQLQRPFLLL